MNFAYSIDGKIVTINYSSHSYDYVLSEDLQTLTSIYDKKYELKENP